MTRLLAITPLTDITTWLRGRGLEIVLRAVLLARFATWCGRRITERMDNASTDEDALVRSEAAKHRAAVAQVLTWISMALIWSVAGVLILQRLGVPVSSLVASAAVIGAALGFGAQQVVRDLLAGLFIVVSASTATATWSTSRRPASRARPARSRRSACTPPACAP